MTDFVKELEMASEKQLEELGKFDKNKGYYENTSDDSTFNWPMFGFVSSIVFPVIAFIGFCFLVVWLYWYFRVRRGGRGDVERPRDGEEEVNPSMELTHERGSKKLTVGNPRKTERQASRAMQCDEDDDESEETDHTTTAPPMNAIQTSDVEIVERSADLFGSVPTLTKRQYTSLQHGEDTDDDDYEREPDEILTVVEIQRDNEFKTDDEIETDDETVV